MEKSVRVLDYKTITQVKDKSLDTIYRAVSFSSRPKHSDLDLDFEPVSFPFIYQLSDGGKLGWLAIVILRGVEGEHSNSLTLHTPT